MTVTLTTLPACTCCESRATAKNYSARPGVVQCFDCFVKEQEFFLNAQAAHAAEEDEAVTVLKGLFPNAGF